MLRRRLRNEKTQNELFKTTAEKLKEESILLPSVPKIRQRICHKLRQVAPKNYSILMADLGAMHNSVPIFPKDLNPEIFDSSPSKDLRSSSTPTLKIEKRKIRNCTPEFKKKTNERLNRFVLENCDQFSEISKTKTVLDKVMQHSMRKIQSDIQSKWRGKNSVSQQESEQGTATGKSRNRSYNSTFKMQNRIKENLQQFEICNSSKVQLKQNRDALKGREQKLPLQLFDYKEDIIEAPQQKKKLLENITATLLEQQNEVGRKIQMLKNNKGKKQDRPNKTNPLLEKETKLVIEEFPSFREPPKKRLIQNPLSHYELKAQIRSNGHTIHSIKKQISELDKINECANSQAEATINDILGLEIKKEKLKNELKQFKNKIEIISDKLEEMSEHGIKVNSGIKNEKRKNNGNFREGATYGACIFASAALSLCASSYFSNVQINSADLLFAGLFNIFLEFYVIIKITKNLI